VAARHLRTVFHSPLPLLRSKVSFWRTEESLVFALSVPLVSSDDHLLAVYRLQDEPAVGGGNDSDVEFIWTSEHSYIAVDKDK